MVYELILHKLAVLRNLHVFLDL